MAEISKEDFDKLVNQLTELTKAIVMLVDSQKMYSHPGFLYTQPRGGNYTPVMFPTANCYGGVEIDQRKEGF